MAHRYCPRCAAEVEDVGGFCLLGHPLKLESEVTSLQELRAQVDQAFEDARVQVAAALAAPTTSEIPPVVAPAPPRAAASPPAPPRTSAVADPPDGQAPEQQDVASATVYSVLGVESQPSMKDPISAFAPAPRMDWGPGKTFLRRRLPRRPSDDE